MHTEPHVSLVVKHKVGCGVGYQHVRPDVKLSPIQKQWIGNIPEEDDPDYSLNGDVDRWTHL